jgi:hypothetical protein
MPTSPIVQLQFALGVAAIVLALWKGRRPERLAALAVAGNIAAGMVADAVEARGGALWTFANDGLTAFIMLAVTLRWARPWLGAVMFFYAAQFALHAGYMATGRDPNDYLHALINNINFTGVILCLGAGAIAAWRGRVRPVRPSGAPSSRAPRR